jgi:hypothetical protein
MRTLRRLLSCLILLLAIAAAPGGPARAAGSCPFISDRDLAGAMPGARWSLISNQDGRGCIYRGGRADTLMLSVFRNPTAQRAKELYAQFVKTLQERLPIAPVSGIGDEAQAGTTTGTRPEASVVTLSGEYILSISVYRSGRAADDTLLKPLTEVARRAIGNVAATSQRFGSCEWLTADDADGFVEASTLTIQRTGAGSCMIFDEAANTLMVAVIAMARGTQVSMMSRSGGCKHVPLPELGKEAFGEHSCTRGNANAVNIYVWKNGRQASILFAPTKPHPESGSVERLKAVAARVYGKL